MVAGLGIRLGSSSVLALEAICLAVVCTHRRTPTRLLATEPYDQRNMCLLLRD